MSAWYGNARIITDASLSRCRRRSRGADRPQRRGQDIIAAGRDGVDAALRAGASCSMVWISARLPPFRRAQRGLGYVPEDRRIFTDLTVDENLRIAAAQSPRADSPSAICSSCFPNLADMLQRSGKCDERRRAADARGGANFGSEPVGRIARRAIRRHCADDRREDARSGVGDEGAWCCDAGFRAERALRRGDCRSRGADRTGKGRRRGNACANC